jgi:sporulation protein YlmC with PRC-barrel domain
VSAPALAQTSGSTTSGSGSSTTMSSGSTSGGSMSSGNWMTQEQPGQWRASKLEGLDVYNNNNEKVGDISEVLVDQSGKIQAVVIGVGGFLGIGEKNVAIPYDQVQWMTNQEVQAQNNQGGSGTNTASGANQPATTGSTGAGGSTAGSSGSSDNMPARGMVRMTKADLQNAPEFRYDNNRANASGGGAGTNPPASMTRPGNAPAQ